MLRFATGFAALYLSVKHWDWTPSIALPIAAILLTAGWFTRWAALVVLFLSAPLLSAAMPLFVLAPEGPFWAFQQADDWKIPVAAEWIARAATVSLLFMASPFDFWPLGIFAALSMVPPGWIPGSGPSNAPERLYYDGHCGLCHRFIQFLLSEDPDGSRFRFSPLDSASFREHVPVAIRANLPDSVVVLTAGNEALTKSAAVLHVLRRLGGYWRILALIGALIPAALRDAVYDFIAGVRRRVFAKPEALCPLMPKELRSRFDV
jgi:predicted DCC family thiol-disulfide oxidoreductase YuxK